MSVLRMNGREKIKEALKWKLEGEKLAAAEDYQAAAKLMSKFILSGYASICPPLDVHHLCNTVYQQIRTAKTDLETGVINAFFLAGKNPEDGINILNRLVKQFPDNPAVWTMRGWLHAISDKPDATTLAHKDLTEALSRDKECLQALYLRSKTFRYLRKLSLAAEDIRNFEKYSPEDEHGLPEVLFELVSILYASNSVPQAIDSAFRKALLAEIKHAELYKPQDWPAKEHAVKCWQKCFSSSTLGALEKEIRDSLQDSSSSLQSQHTLDSSSSRDASSPELAVSSQPSEATHGSVSNRSEKGRLV